MTRLLAVKLLRDLLATRTRTAAMVLALATSLFVLGSALYVRTVVDLDIGPDYLGTNPASATLLLDGGVDPHEARDLLAAVRKRPGVAGTALRAQLTARMQAPDGHWSPAPLQLFVAAPDDPMRVAGFRSEQGRWPAPAGAVLVERDALAFLGLKVGDRLIVQTPDGAPTPLRITGAVADPTLAPASQEQKGYGYISTASLPALGEPARLDELKVLTPTRDHDAVVRETRDLAAWLERTRGVRVQEIQVPPAQSPHQGWMDKILWAVLAFGAISLLLSAILAATMVNGLLTRQVPEIGILKAIGARSSTVLQLYLAMVALVAGLATAVAFVPGILFGRVLAQAVLRMELNMDVTSFPAPWWTYATVIAAGLGLPLLVSLVPLTRAVRTTVRRAIDARVGRGAQPGARHIDAALAGLRGVDRIALVGFRNTFRHPARLLLMVVLLGTAGSLFVGGLNTWNGIQTVVDQAAGEQRHDVQVQLARPATGATLTAALRRLPHVTHVEAWTMVPAAVHRPGRVDVTDTYPDQGHLASWLVALPPGTTELAPHIVDGRWLRPGDVDAVVVPQGELPGVAVGDVVRLTAGGRVASWHVAGIASEVGASFYVSTAGYEAATGTHGRSNLIEIVTDRHDPPTQAAVAEAADQAIDTALAQPASYTEAVVNGHVYILAATFLVIAAAIAIVGCIGLASTMSASVLERTRELGVMKAIGARASTVRRMVLAEAVSVALLSCLAGVVPALVGTAALGGAIGSIFGLPVAFQLSLPAALAWAAAIVAGAALASLAPALRAGRLTVREALAYV